MSLKTAKFAKNYRVIMACKSSITHESDRKFSIKNLILRSLFTAINRQTRDKATAGMHRCCFFSVTQGKKTTTKFLSAKKRYITFEINSSFARVSGSNLIILRSYISSRECVKKLFKALSKSRNASDFGSSYRQDCRDSNSHY